MPVKEVMPLITNKECLTINSKKTLPCSWGKCCIRNQNLQLDADQKLYDEKVAQVKQCQAVIIDLQRQLNVLEAKEKEWEALLEKEKELSHWAAAEARRQEADWLEHLLRAYRVGMTPSPIDAVTRHIASLRQEEK